MQAPVLTETELKRGWAEREIKFTDGKREFVRVHALTQAELISLVKLSPADALAEGIQKSLRWDREFVARICAASQLAISAMLAQLCARSAGGFAPQISTTQTGSALHHG